MMMCDRMYFSPYDWMLITDAHWRMPLEVLASSMVAPQPPFPPGLGTLANTNSHAFQQMGNIIDPALIVLKEAEIVPV
jgi:hypothetical protein